MAKLLYSVGMSLDGFIAGVDGDMTWLGRHAAEATPQLDELVNEIGAILSGGRTFRGSDANAGTEKEGAFEGRWHGSEFVLTSHPPSEPIAGVTFRSDLSTAVAEARAAAAGKTYVNVLGANLARSCLRAGLLDEVLVVIVPVLLGDGTRIFDWPGGTEVSLERIDANLTTEAANLWYRINR